MNLNLLFILLCFFNIYQARDILEIDTATTKNKHENVNALTLRINNILKRYYEDWKFIFTGKKVENVIAKKNESDNKDNTTENISMNDNVIKNKASRGWRVCSHRSLMSLLKYLCKVYKKPTLWVKKGRLYFCH